MDTMNMALPKPMKAVDLAQMDTEAPMKTALRFTHASSDTLKRLAGMPEMGSLLELPNPALAGIRVWRVRGFKNYLIFYRPLSDGIRVLRVLHAARDIESILGDT